MHLQRRSPHLFALLPCISCRLLLLLLVCTRASAVPLLTDESLVELNHVINNNTLHWITVRSFDIKTYKGSRKDSQGHEYFYQSDDVAYNSHTGTHLDAPCHFAREAWCVNSIPVENLFDRPLFILDVRESVKRNKDYQVSVDDYTNFARKHEIPEGFVLFIATDWYSYWPMKDEYFGIRNNNESDLHFPGISAQLAQHLADANKIVGIGIEGPSVDAAMATDMLAHRILAAKNVYNIENLPKMHKIPSSGSRVTIAPLNVENASGSPCRVFVRRPRGASREESSANAAVNGAAAAATTSGLPGPSVLAIVSPILMSLISFFLLSSPAHASIKAVSS